MMKRDFGEYEEIDENVKIEHKDDGIYVVRTCLPGIDEKVLEDIHKNNEESKRDAENLIKGRFRGFKGGSIKSENM